MEASVTGAEWARERGVRNEVRDIKEDRRTQATVATGLQRGFSLREMGSHWRVLTRRRQDLTLQQDHAGCHAEERLWGGKCRDRTTNQAVATVQVRDGGDVNQVGGRGGGKKYLDSGEKCWQSHGWDSWLMDTGMKQGSPSGLSSWRDGVTICWDGRWNGRYSSTSYSISNN